MAHRFSAKWAARILLLIGLAAALIAAGIRFRTEHRQKTVSVLFSMEDLNALEADSGISRADWLCLLTDAGVTHLVADEAELPAAERLAADCGTAVVRLGGEADGTPYLFRARYDTLAAPDSDGLLASEETQPIEPILRSLTETDSLLILVEDKDQMGSVLPSGCSLSGFSGRMAKCFWLNQTFRRRWAVLGYEGAEEIVNMCCRAVIDRGMSVLWLTPFESETGTVTDPSAYADALTQLEARLNRAGYALGTAAGISDFSPPALLQLLIWLGIFAGAVLLLLALFPGLPAFCGPLLLLLAIAECLFALRFCRELQITLIALLASIVFPCLAVFPLRKALSEPAANTVLRFPAVLGSCLLPVLAGCLLISAAMSDSEYLLVLKLFRGVKLSQLAAPCFTFLLLTPALLHRKDRSIREDVRALRSGSWIPPAAGIALTVLILILAAAVLILRSGDGMLRVSVFEQRVRNLLERWLLYRPRTKEFVIAWPALALSLFFAGRKHPLPALLFGVLSSIGFASVTNTFCHLRAHLAVSVLRTLIGLAAGLIIGAVLFGLCTLLFRKQTQNQK